MWVEPLRRHPARAFWFGCALAISGVLGVARWLEPAAAGFGTHTQLGLPPCGFHWLSGYPCPACGLTTSFAHMARGELAQALRVHASGALLFALCVAAAPLAVWAGMRELPVAQTSMRVRFARIGVVIACVMLVEWLGRIAWLVHA